MRGGIGVPLGAVGGLGQHFPAPGFDDHRAHRHLARFAGRLGERQRAVHPAFVGTGHRRTIRRARRAVKPAPAIRERRRGA